MCTKNQLDEIIRKIVDFSRETFAVENMAVSEESIKNLKRIDKEKVSYTDVIDELKHKYMQRV